MSYASDFLIENGILKEYYGSGGEVEIPWGVTEIAPYAFCYCDIERLILPKNFVRLKKEALRRVKHLEVLEISGNTLKFGKDLFIEDGIFPSIVATKMQLGDVPQELKKYFCLGFAKEEEKYSDSFKETYIKYIKHQRKDLMETALLGDSLLRLMLREKMLSREESSEMISMLTQNGKTELSADVLRYQTENFKPIDPFKEMLREANKDPFSKSEMKKIWEYEIADEGVIIKLYKGNEEIISVPPRIGKIPVVEIGECCFHFSNRPRPPKGIRMSSITEISLPDTVHRIGKRAFDGCTELQTINFPNEMVEIMAGSFEDCKSISQIEFPESLRKIGSRAFLRCDGLSSVVIPDNVEIIESYAFSGCRNLISVQIKGHCEKLQTEAFSDCFNLEKVVIEDGIKYLGYGVFGDCESLEDIYLPESICEIGRNAFYGCKNLTIHAPEGSFAHSYAVEHRIDFLKSE